MVKDLLITWCAGDLNLNPENIKFSKFRGGKSSTVNLSILETEKSTKPSLTQSLNLDVNGLSLRDYLSNQESSIDNLGFNDVEIWLKIDNPRNGKIYYAHCDKLKISKSEITLIMTDASDSELKSLLVKNSVDS